MKMNKQQQNRKFGNVTLSFQQKRVKHERIVSNIIAGEGVKDVFRKTLETHRQIKDYISKIKNENPNMALEDLKMLTSGFIEKKRFKNYLFSSIELELYYIDKIVNNGGDASASEGAILTFLETSLNNKRITLGGARKSITFHDLDVQVMLEHPIPEFIPQGHFYVNVGSANLETLEDLHLSIFYKPAVAA